MEPIDKVKAAYNRERKLILKYQLIDRKALFLLYKESTFEKIAEVLSSKKVWGILGRVFKGDEPMNKFVFKLKGRSLKSHI